MTIVLLAACQAQAPGLTYEDNPGPWKLIELDGARFVAPAVMSFGADGQISGRAPCNSFFGNQTARYPAFRVAALGGTEMACDALMDEQRFYDALGRMDTAELSADILILHAATGGSMVFERDRLLTIQN